MRDQVTRHLERARHRGPRRRGRHHHRRRAGGAIARAHLGKTHHGKSLAVELDAPEHASFRGEKQDLEEMVGNLVDNACKWASARVVIEVVLGTAGAGPAGGADRGRRRRAGAHAAEREQVARRGRRLDETKPGSGLGLSIVVELAALYGGALNLGNSPIGGLRAELVLPAG